MAGRHVRKAPVVISRVIATVTVSALLLAVGVVAMTIFTGGERRATGGPQGRAPHVVTGPSAVPSSATSLPTSDGTSGQTSPGPSSGGGAVVGAVGADGGGPATPAWAFALQSAPSSSSTTSAEGPSRFGLPLVPVGVDVGVDAYARGWLQRSDNGRAHGRAVGLLGRVGTAHGCRPVPKKSKPFAAQVEPRACR